MEVCLADLRVELSAFQDDAAHIAEKAGDTQRILAKLVARATGENRRVQ